MIIVSFPTLRYMLYFSLDYRICLLMLKIVSAAIRRLHRVTEIEMQKKLSKYLAESDDREGH